MVGICEFCGQVVECGDCTHPDEVAWQHCSCGDARHRRKLAQQVAEAMEHVDELCGPGAGAYGMAPIQSPSAVGLLKDAVAEVGSGGAASVSVVIPGGGTVTVKMGSKLEIKVSRRISRTQTMEAGI